MQVPTFPALPQVSHVPVQAVLQQTPSAQKVDAQSVPVLQGCPICAVAVVGPSGGVPMSTPGWTMDMSFLVMPPSVLVLPPPPPLHPPSPDRTRIDATRSARTLGWGKPMVIERAFLT